jgi:hypothetical protein
MTLAPFILEFEYGNGHLFAVEFYDEGMHIIDVTDPYDPNEVEFYPIDWGEDVWIQGDYAYVTSFHDGFFILDISDPANPVRLGWINEPFMFGDIAVSGDLAFALISTGDDDLRVYDVSDPNTIVELDRTVIPGDGWDIVAQGTYAYIADGITGMTIFRAKGAQPCFEDINGDDTVNVDDLFAVINAWGDCDDCPEDVNADGVVNVDDLFAVINAWGPCP